MNFSHKYGIEKQSDGIILTLYVSGTTGTSTHKMKSGDSLSGLANNNALNQTACRIT